MTDAETSKAMQGRRDAALTSAMWVGIMFAMGLMALISSVVAGSMNGITLMGIIGCALIGAWEFWQVRTYQQWDDQLHEFCEEDGHGG